MLSCETLAIYIYGKIEITYVTLSLKRSKKAHTLAHISGAHMNKSNNDLDFSDYP